MFKTVTLIEYMSLKLSRITPGKISFRLPDDFRWLNNCSYYDLCYNNFSKMWLKWFWIMLTSKYYYSSGDWVYLWFCRNINSLANVLFAAQLTAAVWRSYVFICMWSECLRSDFTAWCEFTFRAAHVRPNEREVLLVSGLRRLWAALPRLLSACRVGFFFTILHKVVQFF